MSNTTIYEYGVFRYYTGNSRVIGPAEGIPLNWTDMPIPQIPSGQFAVFVLTGWELTDQPFVPPFPPAPPPIPTPAPPPGTASVALDQPSGVTVL